MTMTFDASARRIAEASAIVPGGVNSNFRLGISPTPLVIERGRGPLSPRHRWQPPDRLLPRHGPDDPRPQPAGGGRRGAAASSTTGMLFAGQSGDRVRGGAASSARWCRRAEKRALRLVGVRGRCRRRSGWRARRPGGRMIVKFEGHYHGWFDNVLWSVAPGAAAAGPPNAPARVAGSAGQDPHAADGVEVIVWNDLDRLEKRLRRWRRRRRHHGSRPCATRRDPSRSRLSRRRARRLHGNRHHPDLRRGHHRLPRCCRAAPRPCSA